MQAQSQNHTIVKLPDGRLARFPRDMKKAEIEEILRQKYPSTARATEAPQLDEMEALALATAAKKKRAAQERQGMKPEIDPGLNNTSNDLTVEQKRKRLELLQLQARARAAQRSPADMSFMGRLKDNVVGVDDGVMSTGEKLATALNMGGESLTLGVVGDETAAAADSLIGRGSYNDRLAHHRGNEARFRRENPKSAFAAEVAPALAPGVGAARAVSKMAGVTGRAIASGLAGGAAGGIYGFAEGEGGFDARRANAGGTALAGLALGAVAPRLTDFSASIPKRVSTVFSRSVERPTVPMLRAAKDVAYKAVDDAGEVFDGQAMTKLSERVKRTFAANNYVPETDNALTATLKILEARAGQPTTLTQLDRIRQNLWKRYSVARDQPQILDAIKAIDDTIEASSGASELMSIARAANARFAKSQLLEDAFQKAADETAGVGSGGNIANKYKQAVKKIIHSKQHSRFFNPEEIDAMRALIHMDDGGIQKARRLIGKMSPSGNGLMLTLHTIAGVSTSGATVPLMMAGHVAKGSADKAAIKAAEELKDYLAGLPRRQVPQVNPAPLAVGSAPAIENGVSGAQARMRQSW